MRFKPPLNTIYSISLYRHDLVCMRIYLSRRQYFKIFFLKKSRTFFEIRLKKENHTMRCVSRERLCRSLLYLWRVLIVALVNAVMLVMLLRAPF